MCRHLLKSGYPLTVYNRTKSKTDELVAEGATYAEPYEMAPNVDALVLMVGFPQDVRRLLFGDPASPSAAGLLSLLPKHALLIDHTTSSPGLAKEIAVSEEVVGKQIDVVDAPVSGGDLGAQNAALSTMCGGTDQAFGRAQPIFQCYSKTVKLLGAAGSGQHCKAGNQIAIAGAMIGVCESVLYAHRVGLDLHEFFDTIKGGAAGGKSLELYAPRIFQRDMDPGFAVEHFVKDLEICLEECRKMELGLPGLALVHQLYVGLKAQGGGKCGTQALIKVLEGLNGGKEVRG